MLPLDASMETIGQAYNGTETFVQVDYFFINLIFSG